MYALIAEVSIEIDKEERERTKSEAPNKTHDGLWDQQMNRGPMRLQEPE